MEDKEGQQGREAASERNFGEKCGQRVSASFSIVHMYMCAHLYTYIHIYSYIPSHFLSPSPLIFFDFLFFKVQENMSSSLVCNKHF